MTKYKNKTFLARILFNSKTFTLLGLIVIILISIPLARKVSQRYRIDQEIKELENEIAELENKNIDLSELAKYLESDQFVEEQARIQFGLKKEGEEVAVVKTDQITEGSESEVADSIFNKINMNDNKSDKQANNLIRWWRYFFN